MLVKSDIYGVFQAIAETKVTKDSTLIAYGIHDHEVVNYGEEAGADLQYCKDHGIEALPLERRGGCIVFNKGDISIVAVRLKNEQFNTRLVEFIIQKLIEKGIHAEAESNDIIIDGHFKVAGCTKSRWDDYRNFSALHISIVPNTEHIHRICTKPRKKMPDGQRKEPAGLLQWGIDAGQIEQWLVEFIKMNYKDEMKGTNN